MIRSYLSDIIINNHKTRREWKIQLTVSTNFTFPKNSNETCSMHTKSHNIEIMTGSETDKVIEKRFEDLLQNYHRLNRNNKRKRVFCASVDLLYYHLQKLSLK